MSAKVVTVTHAADGIRIQWPGSTASTYANAVWLAESYAQFKTTADDVRGIITEGIALSIIDLEEGIRKDKPAEDLIEELKEIRLALCEQVKRLV